MSANEKPAPKDERFQASMPPQIDAGDDEFERLSSYSLLRAQCPRYQTAALTRMSSG
jgi:hypothetical protein